MVFIFFLLKEVLVDVFVLFNCLGSMILFMVINFLKNKEYYVLCCVLDYFMRIIIGVVVKNYIYFGFGRISGFEGLSGKCVELKFLLSGKLLMVKLIYLCVFGIMFLSWGKLLIYKNLILGLVVFCSKE